MEGFEEIKKQRKGRRSQSVAVSLTEKRIIFNAKASEIVSKFDYVKIFISHDRRFLRIEETKDPINSWVINRKLWLKKRHPITFGCASAAKRIVEILGQEKALIIGEYKDEENAIMFDLEACKNEAVFE